MAKKTSLWGLRSDPSFLFKIIFGLFPFIIILVLYFYNSHLRLLENPSDKILPSLNQMIEAVQRLAFEPDKRTEEYVLWVDTFSSLRRLAQGVFLASLFGLAFGLNMGLNRGLRSIFLPVITFISIIPPLALLPILFIAFGVDELAKVMLIFIGIGPVIARDLYNVTSKIPKEQIIKALTLGATELQVVLQVILPQIIPSLLTAIRLTMGPAWLFLIASEAIASTDGLGYRIFLVRRYLAMDVIIPYALWITFIGFSFDFILRKIISIKYAWYVERE